MNGTLPAIDWPVLIVWVAVVAMAIAGSWMYFVLRPYAGPWYKLVGVFVPAVFGGVAISQSLCEAYALESTHHKMVSAFFSALLCMPISRAALLVTETEAAGWIKQMVLRVLGVKDNNKTDTPDEPPEDTIVVQQRPREDSK